MCRWSGLRGTATADEEPNPALHLTPPADSGRIAHPMMAVQVSFLFGHRGLACERATAATPCRGVARLP
ncbi:hypothetical protein C1280_14880 [Gemmata obscuriglobus]|uniref:Uncharacterized protein n=1 Tax=Gemmata obscuriglobus TaxID=114 RepID=A0A2Z3GXN0_9BACT|nr:hypothetical protein C1280_14880 [Gemmata obscuriglobus]